ncbi:PfkB family carbohydrate kinase [Fusibacter sp. JL216-2]|uniref:PfkB family carbohydrate kinase n=1 Tax=Fusibacter sp. JL216-2 TaxID=3071453 RepID=UPI003D33215B
MTNREREIYQLLRENPMISQKEIADLLGIQRSSVAVHILNLTKKGVVKGKGYILSEGEYVLVIGGSNVDITGFPKDLLRLEDSNPGSVKMSLGGVGRNIGENLARLGMSTKMMTAVGKDVYGQKIIEESRLIDLDMSQALVLENASTSIYLSIMDEEGDMKLALSDMDIAERIDIDYINKNARLIRNAAAVVVDANLNQSVLEYLFSNFKDVKFFVDTVSAAKAMKLKNLLGYVHTIKPNRIETEALTGVKVKTVEDAYEAIDVFLNQGIKQVFISLGQDGVVYGSEDKKEIFKPKQIKMVNATGAGDAFMAAIVFSWINNFEPLKTLAFSSCASALAISCASTINPDLSEAKVNALMDELYNI